MSRSLSRQSIIVGAAAAALLLSGAAHSQAAAPKKPSKTVTAAPQDTNSNVPVPKPVDAGYEQWLKKYGAYDKVVPVNPETDDGSPGILKRAEAHLIQGAPQQALGLVENLAPYPDAALEIQRLWIGGLAQRALGDPYKAVIWFSQAGRLMEPQQLKAKLTAEVGLEPLWVDVFRRQYWAYVATPSASREALELTLQTLLTQAENTWGAENFWVKSKEVLAQSVGNVDPSTKAPEAASKDAMTVTDVDRKRIAQMLTAVSLENYGEAKTALSGVADPALKDFWRAFANFVQKGKPHDMKVLSGAGYAKAAGFWNANLLAPFAGNRDEWLIGNSNSAAWIKFRSNLLQLSSSEAREAVDKEMQSLLLSDDMARMLRSAKFALLLQAGEVDGAKEIWDTLDKRKLPLTLRVAGAILYRDDLKTLLPQEIGASGRLSPALSALVAAAGLGSPLPGESPFWTKVEVGKSSNVNKLWPLDRLLVLADWQARWVAAPGPELARRSAFLFPETAYGFECLTYLTRKSIDERYFLLATTYLNRMAQVASDPKQQGMRLGLKAKMERESGKDDDALATYQDIIALGRDIDPKTRLDMATFLQLKNDFAGAKKQLLILWDQRETMPKSLQAEILFWLGEGEHSQKNYDEALDYYLNLAYQYSKESMWPTVAMYRASMIYELKGKYDAARKFLNAVINTADRKEEREAARNRLNAIDAKIGKQQPGTANSQESTVYPF